MTKPTCPPDLLEIFIKGTSEIIPVEIGRDSAGGSAAPTGDIGKMVEQIGTDYGRLSSCGLLFRSGAASFKYLVRNHGKSIGIDSLAFRLQPPRKRLMDGLQKIVNLIEVWKAAGCQVRQSGDDVELTFRSTALIGQESAAVIWLHFPAGMIQEFLYWAGGGKQYPFQVKVLESDTAVVIQFRLQPVD